MASGKVKEAEECIERAEKCMKTSLFKWKPDLDSAANEYKNAATCYKSAKQLNKCLQYNLKAAECYQQNRQFFPSAKCYEQAALISGKELQNWKDAITLIEKSCLMFREHGVPDTAALTYDRGAKMIESTHPDMAVNFYIQASEITMAENRPTQAAEYSGKAARILIKLKRYEEAIDNLNKQMAYYLEAQSEHSCGRLVVHIVLVHLTRDDYVAAKKAFDTGRCFVEQEELYTLTQLLESYDTMDTKKIVSSLNHPFIKNLDIEYSKLARALQQKYGASLASETGSNNQIDEISALL